jgi:hypothetical protein
VIKEYALPHIGNIRNDTYVSRISSEDLLDPGELIEPQRSGM